MKILISNDDGVTSPGILALAEAAKSLGEVFVVAPHRERSTAGHSLTLHKPLRISKVGENIYATSGTPADCIYLGIREVLKGKPDLILSGINQGANLGTDVHYSGTVAAAREGALMNIPSYAFSLVDLRQIFPNEDHRGARYDEAAKIAVELVRATHKNPFPPHTLLNVNIPNRDIATLKGYKVARQGFRYYANEVTRGKDPRGKDYFWIGGAYLGFERNELTDCHAVNESWVSVTPITIDCTHTDFYNTLKMSDIEEKRF
jgi:5'-nucleotidase